MMKTIKLILMSVIAAAMLTSCGRNNTNDMNNVTPVPHATENNSGNVSDTDNGMVEEDVRNAGDNMGNAVDDVGNAAGDVVEGVGNAAGDVVNGVGDAVGANDSNNNGR